MKETITRYPQSEAATFEQVEAVAEQFKMAYIRDDMTLFEKEMAIIEYLLVHFDYDHTSRRKFSLGLWCIN